MSMLRKSATAIAILFAGGAVFASMSIVAIAASAIKSDKKLPVTGKPNNAAVWQVSCASAGVQSKLRCKMVQTLFVTKTRKRVLQVSITSPRKKGDKPSMLLALPHGLYLPAGVVLSVDKKQTKKLPVQTADQNGSYAGFALEPNMVKALKSGTNLVVSITSIKRKKIRLGISLTGFSTSYDRVVGQK